MTGDVYMLPYNDDAAHDDAADEDEAGDAKAPPAKTTPKTPARPRGPQRAPLRDSLTGELLKPPEPGSTTVYIIKRDWYAPTRGESRVSRQPNPSTPVPPAASTPPSGSASHLRPPSNATSRDPAAKARQAAEDFGALQDVIAQLYGNGDDDARTS